MIIDATFTHEECIAHYKCPLEILERLVTLQVEYFDFDEQLHQGQIVVDRDIEHDVIQVFSLIKEIKFPVHSVIPMQKFSWDDDSSMLANNSSAFNYRPIAGTNTLSLHSFGRAVDINPVQNPWYIRDEIHPPTGNYEINAPGTLLKDGPIVQLFTSLGWEWGGDWISIKDYHHFQKPLQKK